MNVSGIRGSVPAVRPSAEKRSGVPVWMWRSAPVSYTHLDVYKRQVFKTVADPFVGKLSYVKVVSGKITADTELYNMRTGTVERLGKMLHTRGKKQEETTVILSLIHI